MSDPEEGIGRGAHDQVVVLGAGRGVTGSTPSAVVDIHHRGRVMDWLLDAFSVLDRPEIVFVGGYRVEDVLEQYPDLRAVFNRDWAGTGPVHSLGLAPVETDRPVFVTYSDVVFRRDAVRRLASAPGEVVVAVDSAWRARYDGRGSADLERSEKVCRDGDRVTAIGTDVATESADAEFAGILVLRPPAVERVFALVESGDLGPRATVPELLDRLRADGTVIGSVDLRGDWAELDARQDLARFVLGTKAESLDRLRGMDHGGEIGALGVTTFTAWREDGPGETARLLAAVPEGRLIVRSSARNEDSWTESGAGRHESILDVERDPAALAAAVDAVFASYGAPEPADQVLVQEMLRDVTMSGVVMTRTHALGAPYYVIEFDDRSTRTDTVTGGGDVRSVVCLREAPLRAGLPPLLTAVLATVQRIEKLVGHDSLDIEFAVTPDERVHVLQVRPIAVNAPRTPVDDAAVTAALEGARAVVAARSAPSPTVVGSRTRYSVMTDWNPAEIIGTRPRRLATSLYRTLVTDRTWATQRAEYGYRDLRPCPLLVELAEQPYVDVRASFASFVPAALSDADATWLVDRGLARLDAEPALHDKVEFEILVTCTAPDFPDAAGQLRADGMAPDALVALEEALRVITGNGFDRLAHDLAAGRAFDAAMARIGAADVPPLERAAHHLALAERGALTFSHLARAGFVATSQLRGLVAVGALAPERVEEYLRGVVTVFGRLQADALAVKAGRLGWAAFVDRYGHLRPGTYEITSPSYRAAADQYLRPLVDGAEDAAVSPPFRWTATERTAVSAALGAVGLPDDVDALDRFVTGAVAGREEGKFVFTRALSAALDDLALAGDGWGLDRDDLSHVAVGDLIRLRDGVVDPGGYLQARVLEGREAHAVSQAVSLPAQIASPADLVCFEQAAAEPNFVTQHSVQAALIDVDAGPDIDVEGRIVMLPSADPGYDWLLARGIAGLITMYGGANSHMAVRAAESGLPAAIGVGERRYAELATATMVALDCGSRTIRVIA